MVTVVLCGECELIDSPLISDVTIVGFSSRFDFDSIFYKEFDVDLILILLGPQVFGVALSVIGFADI